MDRKTTPPMSSGSRLAMLSVLSIDVAVTPPTWTTTPVPSVALREDVVAQGGDQVLGGGVLRPAGGHHRDDGGVAVGVGVAGETAATPGVAAIAAVMPSRAAAPSPAGSSATRTSGPFMPGPKPSASRS